MNNLLRAQHAFVYSTVAVVPPPPLLYITLKLPLPPSKQKVKKQPAKRKSEVATLSDVNHRALLTTYKEQETQINNIK